MTEPRRPARRRALLAFAAVAALFLGLFAPPALAQDAEDEPTRAPELLLVDDGNNSGVILRTDGQPTKVDIMFDGVEAASGSPRWHSVTPVGHRHGDGDHHRQQRRDRARCSSTPGRLRGPHLHQLGAGDDEEITVWTTGGVARLRVGLNTAHDRTDEHRRGASSPPPDSNKLYDAIRSCRRRPRRTAGGGATQVIVFAGSIDAGSIATAAEARGAVLDGGGIRLRRRPRRPRGSQRDRLAPMRTARRPRPTAVRSPPPRDPRRDRGLRRIRCPRSSTTRGTCRFTASDQIADNNQLERDDQRHCHPGVLHRQLDGATAGSRARAPFSQPSRGGIPGLALPAGRHRPSRSASCSVRHGRRPRRLRGS